MKLSPREKDKLLISVAAMVARNRKQRGVKLNYPEAVALITDFVVEGAREGKSVAELISFGSTILNTDDVMPGVSDLISIISYTGSRYKFSGKSINKPSLILYSCHAMRGGSSSGNKKLKSQDVNVSTTNKIVVIFSGI